MFVLNKRGISAVVATVLIILITVAAVTIVWTAVIPLLNNKIQEETACQKAASSISLGEVCIGAEKKSQSTSFAINKIEKKFPGLTETYKAASTIKFLNKTTVINNLGAKITIEKDTVIPYSQNEKVRYLEPVFILYQTSANVEQTWSEQLIFMQLKRTTGEFDLSDIQLFIKEDEKSTEGIYILKDLGESEGITVDDLPNENQDRELNLVIPDVYGVIKIGNKLSTVIKEVAIAPAIKIGNSEKTCEISSKKPISICSSAYDILS